MSLAYAIIALKSFIMIINLVTFKSTSQCKLYMLQIIFGKFCKISFWVNFKPTPQFYTTAVLHQWCTLVKPFILFYFSPDTRQDTTTIRCIFHNGWHHRLSGKHDMVMLAQHPTALDIHTQKLVAGEKHKLECLCSLPAWKQYKKQSSRPCVKQDIRGNIHESV